MITCEHCREELPEYALGHASVETAATVDEHLAACVVCRRELAEVQSAWSALALALPPATPRREVFDRVLAKIALAPGPTPRQQQRPAKPPALNPRQRLWSYALAAGVAFALVGGSIYVASRGTDPQSADALANAALRDLADRLGNLQQLDRMLQRGNVKLASLHRPAATDTGAFVVWDLPNREWHFYALSLPPAPAGKTYQLWAVAEGAEPLPGPAFDVGRDGVGAVVADFATLAPQASVRAVVTIEPDGGSPKPTGETVLEAAL
jgi:anti-sigma-K factor RskA